MEIGGYMTLDRDPELTTTALSKDDHSQILRLGGCVARVGLAHARVKGAEADEPRPEVLEARRRAANQIEDQEIAQVEDLIMRFVARLLAHALTKPRYGTSRLAPIR